MHFSESQKKYLKSLNNITYNYQIMFEKPGIFVFSITTIAKKQENQKFANFVWILRYLFTLSMPAYVSQPCFYIQHMCIVYLNLHPFPISLQTIPQFIYIQHYSNGIFHKIITGYRYETMYICILTKLESKLFQL